MARTSAYQCDGPNCLVIAPRGLRKKGPDGWLRMTIATDGDKTRMGAFHTDECAQAWVEQELGFDAAPIVKAKDDVVEDDA